MLYYFAVNALPPLALGSAPSMSYEEARGMLSLNLSSKDWRKVSRLQLLFDIRNIRALWMGLPLDPRGNLSEKELEEALLVRDPLPAFVGDFLDRYEPLGERLRYFASLYSSLYAEAQEEEKGFLQKYYQLEREIRLCLAALWANAFQRDLLQEFQFEDPSDPFVAYFLAQKESADLMVPQEYEDLKAAILENGSDPKELHRAVLEFRMKAIEELQTLRAFSMDRILGYLARLAIVEDWAKLDKEKGHAALEQICR